jgi:hypothetical protein
LERKIKPKTCRNCGEKFSPNKSTQVCCSYTCALNLARKKVIEEGFKELKEKVKTLSQYEAEAKTVFQRWVRLRDKDKPCISCGVTVSSVWDGGHFKKAEIYSGVIFNELNTNRQCGKCNRYLGGNELNYRVGLIAKIGLEAVEQLEQLANETRKYKYSKDELIEIKKTYQTKIKQLTK